MSFISNIFRKFRKKYLLLYIRFCFANFRVSILVPLLQTGKLSSKTQPTISEYYFKEKKVNKSILLNILYNIMKSEENNKKFYGEKV